jgi:hypothetical protein
VMEVEAGGWWLECEGRCACLKGAAGRNYMY